MDTPSRQRKVTLKDVAERAGVDRSVVSRVINNDPVLNIREETRNRVRRAVEELDYRPNAIARSLRTSQAGSYGLLIPDFTNPIYTLIIRGAEAAAARADHLLLTGSISGESFEPERYVELLARGRVDGLLLAGTVESGELMEDQLSRLGLPYVWLNRRPPESRRYVILDDERAAALAVGHLDGLGHTRIAHISGPLNADTAQRRLSGYLKATKEAGLGLDEQLVVEADYTNVGGAQAMGSLLKLPQAPTAVFVANVASAIGALYAAKLAGFSVPDDVSVVAVHDLPMAGYLAPPLTTVRMPLEALGRRGVELLSAASERDAIEEVLAMPMELIVRRSTQRLASSRAF
jgi:LacI family transcriptional regulator